MRVPSNATVAAMDDKRKGCRPIERVATFAWELKA